MRQAGDEAQCREAFEGRRKGAGNIAGGKDRHHQQEQRAARHLRGEHGDDRRADDDAERIGADHVAGLRRGDAEGIGDVGQKPHDDELTRSDAEAADSQRQRHQRNGGARRRFQSGLGIEDLDGNIAHDNSLGGKSGKRRESGSEPRLRRSVHQNGIRDWRGMDMPPLVLSMTAVLLSRAFFAVQHVVSCISLLRPIRRMGCNS